MFCIRGYRDLSRRHGQSSLTEKNGSPCGSSRVGSTKVRPWRSRVSPFGNVGKHSHSLEQVPPTTLSSSPTLSRTTMTRTTTTTMTAATTPQTSCKAEPTIFDLPLEELVRQVQDRLLSSGVQLIEWGAELQLRLGVPIVLKVCFLLIPSATRFLGSSCTYLRFCLRILHI